MSEPVTASPDRTAWRAALAAGISLLAMAVIAPSVNFAVLSRIMVPGDAAATAANAVRSMPLLRAGIVLLLVVCLLDVAGPQRCTLSSARRTAWSPRPPRHCGSPMP